MKKRLQNFEFLRIISMIMITIHHYAYHSGILLCQDININKFIGEFIVIGGKIGVNLFIMISAYFLIDSKFEIRKLIKLIIEVWIYSIVVGIIGACLSGGLTVSQLKQTLFPILTAEYWFITAYLGLYLISPFLNLFLKNIKEKNLKVLLIILTCLLSLIALIPGIVRFNNDYTWLIYLYLITAYIKIYNVKIFDSRKKALLVSTASYLLMFTISVVATLLSLKNVWFSRFIVFYSGLPSIFILISSLGIFEIFKKVEIKKESKLITFFASSSFAVYLVQEQIIFKDFLWLKIVNIPKYYDSSILIFVASIIISTVVIYGVVAIVDKLVKKIIQALMNKLEVYKEDFDKINEKINV